MSWISSLVSRAKRPDPVSLSQDVTAIIGPPAIVHQPRLVPDDRLAIPPAIKEYVVPVQAGTQLTLYVAAGYETRAPFRSLCKQLGRSRFWTLQPPQIVPGEQLISIRDSLRVAHPEAPTRAQLDIAEFIRRAAKAGATDIQLRQHRNCAGYRFSIDGEYTGNLATLTKLDLREMNATLFGMADEGSVDGYYTDNCTGGAAIVKNLEKFGISDTCIAVRLQFAPTAHGPECSIRLQSVEQVARPLDDLGLRPHHVQLLRDLSDYEGGATLFSGPTGAAKTTLLAAVINDYFIRHPDERGITIEDPVEIHLHDAVSQWPMTAQDAEIRATELGRHIRKALRCHPQLLMLGECRDNESADAFLQGGLTGVVGLSTVHTTNALTIIPRLRAWGIDNYILTNTAAITGLVAVRLPKTLCPHCRIPLRVALAVPGPRSLEIERAHQALASYAGDAFPLRNEPVPSFTGACVRKLDGCPHCRSGKREGKPSYGDSGRTLIAEIIQPDEQLLQLMSSGRFSDAERHVRCELGVPSLREDAIERVAGGQICILDAYNATGQFSPHRLRGARPPAHLKAAS